jgi:hypothetical protein
MSRLALLTLFALTILPGPAHAAAPPPWLRQIAAANTSTLDAAAVVLLDQEDVVVTTDGKLHVTRRYAAKLRDDAGRPAASVRQVYLTDGGKVRELHGWIIRASGAVRELGGSDIADVALVENDVYNEVRAKVLGAGSDIAAGDVFGAEVESEERLLFAQVEWTLQDRWPTRQVRRTLTLPSGWTSKSLTFNHADVAARTEGNIAVWELRDLPEIPLEEAMPPLSDLAPRIAVSIFGPSNAPAPGQFSSWSDVATWLQALSPQAAKPTDAVARKATELASTATSEMDRIRAIARFVQSVQYVSIQTGLWRGGGYQPRPADLVLQRNYGDCKDKANLMRAMLAAIGIRSHMVSLYSGDRNYVRAEWPSPQQFNHAIVAVALAEPASAPSILDHKTLGRLLIFDPTNPYAPPGELPLEEQGSLALIAAPDGSSLERLPTVSPSYHRVVRRTDATTGELTARIKEDASGDEAIKRAASFAMIEQATYRDLVARRIAAGVPGARVAGLKGETSTSAGHFVVTMEITAGRYAQPMGQLAVVKPPVNLGVAMQAAIGGARRTPFVVRPQVVEETMTLDVPAGLIVDELPQATSLDTAFGRYSLSYKADGTRITGQRTLEVPLKTVPLADYAALRAFFDKVRAADAAPIVLKR